MRALFNAGMVGKRLALAACLGLVVSGPGPATAADLQALPPLQLDVLEPQVKATLIQAREAFERSSKAASDAEQRARAHADLARMLHAHDQVAAARVSYDNALRIAPGQFEWIYLRAMLELAQGNIEAALSGFDQAVQRNEQYAAAYLRRGDLLFNLGRASDAEADYKRVLAMQSDSAAARAGLGQVALQAGSHAEAISHFEAALAAQPGASRLRTALGLAYRNQGDMQRAREVLAQRGDKAVWFEDPLFDALAALRQNPAVFFEQGRALAAEGRTGDALQLLAKAVELAPEDALFLAEYGQLLYTHGDFERAGPMLDRAWQAGSRTAALALLRARMAQRDGHLEQARSRYLEAVELDPQGDDIRVELARLAMRLQAYELAAEQFAVLQARTSGAERNYAQYWLGLAQAMLRQCEAADRALSEVLQASGGRDGWAMLALARLRASCPEVSAEKRSAAAAWAEQLYRQHPGVETGETLAMVRAAAGDYAAALSLQREALQRARQSGAEAQLMQGMQDNLQRFEQSKPAQTAFSPASPLLREN